MLIESIRLLEKDETGFTSVKFLADSLKEMGYPMHKKKFVTYMEHLLDLGWLRKQESTIIPIESWLLDSNCVMWKKCSSW